MAGGPALTENVWGLFYTCHAKYSRKGMYYTVFGPKQNS